MHFRTEKAYVGGLAGGAFRGRHLNCDIQLLLREHAHNVKGVPYHTKIGQDTIQQEKSAKLLGITFNEKQNWRTHILGKGGVVSALNRRLFAMRRLKSHINKKSLLKVVDGFFTSKINYGLQLYA